MTLEVDVHVQLGDLTLDVALEAGDEPLAVVGPNGAGKTTLLRAVAGLVPVARGCIRLGRRVLVDTATGVLEPPERRGIGVVFQDYLLFPHRSALDNVAFGLRANGSPAREARRIAADALKRVGLGQQLRSRPAQLSGGQAQRVALARALAPSPAALLLDEPLAALDVAARQEIRQSLRQHLDEFAGPTLLVTHDPVEAATLARRLVVVEDGVVTHAGTLDDITRHPRTTWAARLAGVNLYRGRGDGRTVVLDGGGRLSVAEPVTGRVFATVPPSAVALHRTRPDGTPRNVWSGTVDGFDRLGDRVRVHLAGVPAITAEITPSAAAELDLGRGGALHVAVKATEISTYGA